MTSVPLLREGEQAVPIGVVTRCFPRIRVAGVDATVAIQKGATLVITPQRPSSNHHGCRVTVSSLEIDHRPVDTVEPRQICGIELGCSCSQLPRPGDSVWLVRSGQDLPAPDTLPSCLQVNDLDLAP